MEKNSSGRYYQRKKERLQNASEKYQNFSEEKEKTVNMVANYIKIFLDMLADYKISVVKFVKGSRVLIRKSQLGCN